MSLEINPAGLIAIAFIVPGVVILAVLAARWRARRRPMQNPNYRDEK